MMYVNLDADEKRVVQVSLALREIPGKESAEKVDAMKEQLALSRKCFDTAKVAEESEAGLKAKIADAEANEAAVLVGCVALVREAGKGDQLPDSTVLDAGIRLYGPEIRSVVRSLGAGGKWLADRAEAIGATSVKLFKEQESCRKDATTGEMKLGAAIHKLREMVSGATAFVHANSAPGSAARAHLKRKVHRKPRDPNAPKKPRAKKGEKNARTPPEKTGEPTQGSAQVPVAPPAAGDHAAAPQTGAGNGSTGQQKAE